MKQWKLVITVMVTLAALSSCSLLTALTATFNGITYDGNGSTGGVVPIDPAKYVSGQKVTVFGNTGKLTKTGDVFSVWNTRMDGSGTSYAPGKSFIMGAAAVTLYAQWTAATAPSSTTYTVTYVANGATNGTAPVDSSSYTTGQNVAVIGNTGLLGQPGYVFNGWNTQTNGTGTEYTAGTSLTIGSANVTLYADWGYVYTWTQSQVIDNSVPTPVPASAISSIVCDSAGSQFFVADPSSGGEIYSYSSAAGYWLGHGSSGGGKAPTSLGTGSYLASDSAGSYIAAAVNGGFIYDDNGDNTWSNNPAKSTMSGTWTSIASDSTGQYLAAAFSGGFVRTSSSFGATGSWSGTASPTGAWTSIASDSTGQYLAATMSGTGIYTSGDYGSTWTLHTPANGASWNTVASDSTGAHLVAAVLGGDIWTSSDGGSTWTDRTLAGSRQWSWVASSSDGTHLVGVVNGGYVWTSTNSGISWTQQTAAGSGSWTSVAMSSNGAIIGAAQNNSSQGLVSFGQ